MSSLPMSSMIAAPERHGGAARLSVFFALWTLALLVVHDVRVNAAPIYERQPVADSGWLTAPPPAPQIETSSMWDAMAQRSDVLSGRWSGVASKRSGAVSHVARVANEMIQPRSAVPDVSRKAVAKSSASNRVHSKDSPKEAPSGEVAETAPIVKSASDVAVAERQVARRIEMRDFEGAVVLIEQARAGNPRAISQLRMLDARVAIGQGDYERAYTTLLEGLPDIQVSTHQHDLLAAVMVRTSRYAEAAAVYRGLLALNSTNIRWWAGYAVTQEKLGRHSELVGAYRTLRTLAQPGTPLAAWAEEQLQRIG
jgi:hypothetical protein